MVELSIVIPMYNEEESLSSLFAQLQPCIEQVTKDYEIICVDDGSRDHTYRGLQECHQRDSRIKAIKLSRNFKKETALTAGIHYATGKAVIPMDADLQDPPELIAEMVAEWKKGFKVVLATRHSRPHDSFFKRKTAEWFYKIINRVATVKIPINTGDYRLMDRVVVEAVKQMPERTRFNKGIFAWVGFSTTTVFFDRKPRAAGITKYNFWNLWTGALDGIFAFTNAPLRIWTYIGGTISVISFLWAIYIIMQTLIFGNPVAGYPSLMVTVLFMGGMQLLSIGIIGEYVGRTYRETKHRPLFLIEETVGI
jgi:glycosyltransferase involved in cell wall biosynthesis